MVEVDRRRLLLAGAGGLIGASAIAASSATADYRSPDALYAAFRQQPATTISLGGGKTTVVFADGAPGLDRSRVLTWIKRCARAVATYFGRWPVANYGLLVLAEPGRHVGHATTFGYAGSVTRIGVGTGAGDAALADDWVLVHEMFHAAVPNLPRRALWLQEGNATWLEPVARAAAGQLPVAEVWRQAVVGMPTGEPRLDDDGMDGTTEHDRLYWGGATFWLRAEIAILEQSDGRHTLCDAMRAINRASGGNSVEWTPERLMTTGDSATGTTALASLYATFAARATQTDLPALFARLGVRIGAEGAVVFADSAPLAAIRRRITVTTAAPEADDLSRPSVGGKER